MTRLVSVIKEVSVSLSRGGLTHEASWTTRSSRPWTNGAAQQHASANDRELEKGRFSLRAIRRQRPRRREALHEAIRERDRLRELQQGRLDRRRRAGAIARAASARHLHSAFDIFLEHDHSVEELREVFEAAMSSNPQGTMAREKICFRCFGIGHTENDDTRAGTKGCPSPKRTPGRDIGAYLLLISALAARQGAGGRRIPTDAMPSPSADAAGERPPRRSALAPPSWHDEVQRRIPCSEHREGDSIHSPQDLH